MNSEVSLDEGVLDEDQRDPVLAQDPEIGCVPEDTTNRYYDIYNHRYTHTP